MTEEAEWLEETETGIKRKVRITSRETPEGTEIEIHNFYSGAGVSNKAEISDIQALKDAFEELD